MDTFSAEAARKDFRRLLDIAHYQGTPTVITKFGQDWAAITPLATVDAAQRAELTAGDGRCAHPQAHCQTQTQALAAALALLERIRAWLPAGVDASADAQYAALTALLSQAPGQPADIQPQAVSAAPDATVSESV